MRGGFLKTVSACALFAVTVGALAQGGSPQYGAWGFDLDGADKATKPGDDFFRYANGAWLDKTAIPADKPGYSLRLAMTDRAEERLHDMMEAAAKQRDTSQQPRRQGRRVLQGVHGRGRVSKPWAPSRSRRNSMRCARRNRATNSLR